MKFKHSCIVLPSITSSVTLYYKRLVNIVSKLFKLDKTSVKAAAFFFKKLWVVTHVISLNSQTTLAGIQN